MGEKESRRENKWLWFAGLVSEAFFKMSRMDLLENRKSYTEIYPLSRNICKYLGFLPSRVRTLLNLQGLKLLKVK
jgi:hypothetical protein